MKGKKEEEEKGNEKRKGMRMETVKRGIKRYQE